MFWRIATCKAEIGTRIAREEFSRKNASFSDFTHWVGMGGKRKKGFFLETCERRSRKKKVSFNGELKLLILVRSVQSYILVCSCRRLAGFLERCVIEPKLSYRGTSALDQSRTADLRSVRLTSWECLPSRIADSLRSPRPAVGSGWRTSGRREREQKGKVSHIWESLASSRGRCLCVLAYSYVQG